MEGWIKIHRKLVDHSLYFAEPFSKVMAWIDLLIITNHKDGAFYKRGIRIEIKRGQSGYDVDTLAKRWKWSRGKVERFLNELELDNQIVRQKNNVTTIISICNYDEYQADDKANGHKTVKQTDTNNKGSINTNVLTLPWRQSFDAYLEECKQAYNKFYFDEQFIATQQKFYPKVNIKKSIERGYEQFWGTEAGWENKKKSKSKKIDWRLTIINSIEFNKVYYTKEELEAQ